MAAAALECLHNQGQAGPAGHLVTMEENHGRYIQDQKKTNISRIT